MAKKSSGVQVYGLLDLKKAEARDLLTRVWYDDFKFWGCIYKVVQLMGKLEVKPADHNGKEGWGLFAGDRLIGQARPVSMPTMPKRYWSGGRMTDMPVRWDTGRSPIATRRKNAHHPSP